MPEPLPQPFTPFQSREERNWKPFLIGIGIVVVVVAGIVMLSRQGKKPASIPDPYAHEELGRPPAAFAGDQFQVPFAFADDERLDDATLLD